MRKIILLIILVLLPMNSMAIGVGDQIPEFNLTTFKGYNVNSKDLKGSKAILLVFWATWCSYCEQKIPELNEIYARFGDKKMAMVGVNISINDPVQRVRKYVNKFNISYPVYYDQKAKLTREFLVIGTPTIIIADKNGLVKYRGTAVPDQFEKMYQELIKGEETKHIQYVLNSHIQ